MRLNLDERGRFEHATLPHLDAAYNLARWLTRDDHAAEDVVQEAYFRAAKFFAGFRGGDGRTWLLAVVRRAAYDWLAKRRAWAAASFDEAVHDRGDDASNPESLVIRKADQQLLRQALEELSPEFREVTVLRELEGLSYQQIAAVVGVPVGTVMSRLSRARKQLRQRLAPCPGREE
ncbi:MAG: polymerase subunit sigma [Gemmataceae bacterium]|nr:polymerase subunit sigma [Gemmataceae bacterium]